MVEGRGQDVKKLEKADARSYPGTDIEELASETEFRCSFNEEAVEKVSLNECGGGRRLDCRK